MSNNTQSVNYVPIPRNGYFTLRLAVATGPEGRVYAVDLANQRLDENQGHRKGAFAR